MSNIQVWLKTQRDVCGTDIPPRGRLGRDVIHPDHETKPSAFLAPFEYLLIL